MAQWAKYRAQLRGNLQPQPDKAPTSFFMAGALPRAYHPAAAIELPRGGAIMFLTRP